MREWMATARNEKNLTMAKVAERCGISESYYSLIEAGERQKRLDITLAVKLSDVLGLPLDEIVKQDAAWTKQEESKNERQDNS